MAASRSLLRGLLEYALFRWESAALIALTLIGGAFAWSLKGSGVIPDWGWLAALGFGLAGEGALIWSTLTDPASRERVLDQLEIEVPELPDLNESDLLRQIDKAVDYYRRIVIGIEKRGDSPLKSQLAETKVQIRDWLKTIYRLAERLDLYRREEPLLKSDRQQAEQRLQELERRLRDERNPRTREQIETTLQGIRDHLATITTLDGTMEQARLRLEQTLSALGTIYSQTMLIDMKGAEPVAVADNLRDEIKEEKAVLDAILVAMDRVYEQEGSTRI